ncbi:MAG: ribbon-helix-helix protein, CopG family [Ottowia sp.]|nr:ribbon-helix-helix protein, CopG family [Ottowia sp.]
MKTTTIRLPAELAREVQERADWLGLSFNAMVAVALDSYLGQDRPRVPAPLSPVAASARAERGLGGKVSDRGAVPVALSRQQRRALEREAAKRS